MKDVALVSGITGQDGSYLAELLLSKGYEVHGIIRRSSSFNTERIDHLYQDPHEKNCNLHLHYGDVIDSSSLCNLIYSIRPTEVYNLAAQSHVAVSFEVPDYSSQVDALGTLRILDAIRTVDKNIKFYQASTSELFGKVQEVPQKETTPFYPRSPYACAKLYSYWIVRNYRESYGMFATNGILFNHESPRRGETFVTRKITKAVANIYHRKQAKLYLGNLDAKRDWGYAPDYVDAMYKIMHHNKPDDFVIATGEMHSVREFCKEAFSFVGLNYQDYVEVDPKYYRPAEVEQLLGDSTKARTELNWKPTVTFKELVRKMVEHDLEH